MAKHALPRRAQVWQVSLDPTIGHEIKKARPAVVVTDDVYNAHNWVVIVIPLTTRDRAEYDQVLIEPPKGGLTETSVTLPDQLRAVDRRRLVKKLGNIDEPTMRQIDRSLRFVLSL